jgi:hypothetical protein
LLRGIRKRSENVKKWSRVGVRRQLPSPLREIDEGSGTRRRKRRCPDGSARDPDSSHDEEKTMRAVLIPVAMSAVLLAGPAFAAQPGGQAAQGSGGQQQAQAGAPGAKSGASSTQNGASGSQQDWQAMSQVQLRGSLEKAGYKNIRIVDAAYVVQAVGPTGDQVVMYINPPDVAATASNAGAGATTDQGASGPGTTGRTTPGKGSGGNG